MGAVGIATARLDTLVLLEDATKKDRAWLLAHAEFELSDKIATLLQKQILQREKHVPLAYIRGKTEFYGREFLVTPDTLEPRPETETMLDLLKQIKGSGFRAPGSVIVDVGTGSGCLAITAKLEWPDFEVYATEINKDALKIAVQNAKKLSAEVTFLEGNLLEPYWALGPEPGALFAILANMPYVPDAHTINQAAMQEPKVAIFGGPDGLDLYRRMFEQIEEGPGLGAQGSVRPQYILTESLPFQHEELRKIAEKSGYKQTTEEDFIQVFRRDYRFD